MAASDVGGSANPTIAEILTKLGTDPKTGLNPGQLQEHLSKYGPNALPEEKKSALSAFLAYFWGPIPWMIEAAARGYSWEFCRYWIRLDPIRRAP